MARRESSGDTIHQTGRALVRVIGRQRRAPGPTRGETRGSSTGANVSQTRSMLVSRICTCFWHVFLTLLPHFRALATRGVAAAPSSAPPSARSEPRRETISAARPDSAARPIPVTRFLPMERRHRAGPHAKSRSRDDSPAQSSRQTRWLHPRPDHAWFATSSHMADSDSPCAFRSASFRGGTRSRGGAWAIAASRDNARARSTER